MIKRNLICLCQFICSVKQNTYYCEMKTSHLFNRPLKKAFESIPIWWMNADQYIKSDWRDISSLHWEHFMRTCNWKLNESEKLLGCISASDSPGWILLAHKYRATSEMSKSENTITFFMQEPLFSVSVSALCDHGWSSASPHRAEHRQESRGSPGELRLTLTLQLYAVALDLFCLCDERKQKATKIVYQNTC